MLLRLGFIKGNRQMKLLTGPVDREFRGFKSRELAQCLLQVKIGRAHV